MSKATPIHEIFQGRAQGVMHMMRKYGAEELDGASSKEPVYVQQIAGGPGAGPTIRYWRKRHEGAKDRQAFVEFGNIQPVSPKDMVFGPETTLNSEQISSTERTIDNRGGYKDLDISFGQLFGKETADEKSEDKSAGGSVKVSIESEQDVEGVASFKEAVEMEAHAEIAESESHSETVSHEDTGEEETSVPVGKMIIITQSRSRADTVQTVTAHGEFTHTVRIGQHTRKVAPRHKNSSIGWDSWEQFKDCVNGDAPDNYPMSAKFKADPPYHADLWALADVSAPLRYTVKFEGKIIEGYAVRHP